MPNIKIDFSQIKNELEEESSAGYPQIPEKKTRNKKLIIGLVIFLILFLGAYGVRNFLSAEDVPGDTGFWTQLKHLISSGNKDLKGESADRINFLLLGVGGEGHDGAYLTDTIILGSFQPKEKKIALMSIPRDLIMPIPGYNWQKINAADAYGEAKNPGHGAELTVQAISQTLQIPIQYYLRVDFSGFKEFIDQLGGVKVCVDNAFSDYNYPTYDFKVQTISFTAGCQMMDGETALRFARSRHGNNGEGSDYARSRRQQKIILAVKEKMLSFTTLANPLTIKKMYDQYQEHVATNLEIWEMLRLAELTKGINKENILSYGLDDGPGGKLESLIGEDGAYLLQPIGGNYDDIRKMVANIFNEGGAPMENKAVAQPEKPKVEAPKPTVKETGKIEIRNGTFTTGLASKIQTALQTAGYNVPTVGNTPFRDYEKNVIYDLSSGKFPQTIEFLTKKLNANVSTSVPNWLKNITTNDIVIILGKEAESLTI